MTLDEFKKEVCGLENKLTPTIGFIYYKPVKIEDAEDEFEYEMGIHDILTITKPAVHLSFITDVYRTLEFVKLDLEFMSSYDADINEVYQYIKNYENDVNDHFNDFTKCPAFAVQIVPNKIYIEKNVHYLELEMPILTSLVSTKTNQMPNMISMLFSMNKVALFDTGNDFVDTDEIEAEIKHENDKEEYEKRVVEEQIERERKKREHLDKLNAEINADLNEGLFEENIIRLDRDDIDEDDE